MNRLSYIAWALLALALSNTTSVVAAGDTIASTPTSPNFPYVAKNDYHNFLTGKWRLKAPAAVVTGAGPNATTVINLPVGATVNASKITIVTLRAAVCEIVKDGAFEVRQWVNGGNNTIRNDHVQKVPFRRGDRVYELDYYGEGECSIWLKGVTGVAECQINGMTGGPELCRYVGSDKPVSEIWAFVQTAKGQKGWIRNPQATGMSRHD